ncbi:urease accessory protein UreD [Sulfitobacter pseudonitzschiae]|uniref:Urease accessory protein UreD n=1 Tax=Pseudosulfitobacter pseudonitzschiae TaxID=1402135 RepID=A0A9Q2RYA8_9RHOB|nr:urease accessory protein UreD [Pseudosulfitobacter pseudonitzschiae]MBM2293478.1 urease accessory protein UreD [Pseudosulfitobacter pseudonitzschiae]MBM2298292.1 urease accessory protein UreD [Pseudosulfitobacter pseudonitzschiae]MBM2303205.1 urease accessory protein UreD [Pseudosulfitobacter pseudonitzschiae]MBM2312989.1 urease accessory protein UreD [Pseudosulfitobacter pseudonitzschiae]MBM2317902.1 urease accessory protein UreD [Pseudosulfitobacter pseudonitzschiae]
MVIPQAEARQPRALGRIAVSSKLARGRSVLGGLHQAGSSKCLFPRNNTASLDAVVLNTAGGITGGDRFAVSAEAEAGTSLCLTTQACERVYRAQTGEVGQVRNALTVGPQARIDWLPQETILFDGAAIDRRLQIDLGEDAQLLMVEPLVFGRAAMGERLGTLDLRDRIMINRAGVPLYHDAIALTGDASTHLAKTFVAKGAGAMAAMVYIAPDAAGQLAPVRAMLPDTAGASLIGDDMLVARFLAADSFELRRSLLPVLIRLKGGPLPRTWMI